MNWHPDGPPMFHHPWWQTWQGLFPLLMILVLAGVVIWLVVRMNRMQAVTAGPAAAAAGPAGSSPSAPPAPTPSDGALEQARMRYANGELDRATFLALWSDLGGAPTPTPEPSPEPDPGVDPEDA